MTKQDLKESFIEHFLTHGKFPNSVFSFSKDLKINESVFFELYASFEEIVADHWGTFYSQVISELKNQEEYQSFSVKEKLLTFHFTFIEELKKNRSFVLLTFDQMQKPLALKSNDVLSSAKSIFEEFAQELIVEGQETREIETRLVAQFTNQYPMLLWKLNMGILEFWIKDKSKFFEKTDTLIEKSVNTSFDFLGKTPLDGLFDLGKFIFQNIK